MTQVQPSFARRVHSDITIAASQLSVFTHDMLIDLATPIGKGEWISAAAHLQSMQNAVADRIAMGQFAEAIDTLLQRHGDHGPDTMQRAMSALMLKIAQTGAEVTGESPSMATTFFRVNMIDAYSRLLLAVKSVLDAFNTAKRSGTESDNDAYDAAKSATQFMLSGEDPTDSEIAALKAAPDGRAIHDAPTVPRIQ